MLLKNYTDKVKASEVARPLMHIGTMDMQMSMYTRLAIKSEHTMAWRLHALKSMSFGGWKNDD
nr:MAG TPA: hypothetical protein [Caudoviricetes sp.]